MAKLKRIIQIEKHRGNIINKKYIEQDSLIKYLDRLEELGIIVPKVLIDVIKQSSKTN